VNRTANKTAITMRTMITANAASVQIVKSTVHRLPRDLRPNAWRMSCQPARCGHYHTLWAGLLDPLAGPGCLADATLVLTRMW